MGLIHLPQLIFERNEETDRHDTDYTFGYFGDYHSYVRNIWPFYEACKSTRTKTYIIGNTDNYLEATDTIEVRNRVSLSELKVFQDKTDVLVHLSNLRGGQIPGKIYHYSSTNKPILFILDGTDEEKEIIYNYFKKYNRYIFCNNDVYSIVSKINGIKKIKNEELKKESVTEFTPKAVVERLITDLE
ncbi:MAG TPA: glycosyltransferase family 4 protein [Gallicola sp.]|nr:glycosyltransferase family 4 protein [Gallicola sp.]